MKLLTSKRKAAEKIAAAAAKKAAKAAKSAAPVSVAAADSAAAAAVESVAEPAATAPVSVAAAVESVAESAATAPVSVAAADSAAAAAVESVAELAAEPAAAEPTVSVATTEPTVSVAAAVAVEPAAEPVAATTEPTVSVAEPVAEPVAAAVAVEPVAEPVPEMPTHINAITLGTMHFMVDDSPAIAGMVENKATLEGWIDAVPRTNKKKILYLLATYLPYPSPEIGTLYGDDRVQLLSFLESLVSMLHSRQAQLETGTIRNSSILAIVPSLEELISSIRLLNPSEEDDLDKMLAGLNEKAIFMLLTRLSWYLMHKKEIKKTNPHIWSQLFTSIHELSLTQLIDTLKGLEEPYPSLSLSKAKDAPSVEKLGTLLLSPSERKEEPDEQKGGGMSDLQQQWGNSMTLYSIIHHLDIIEHHKRTGGLYHLLAPMLDELFHSYGPSVAAFLHKDKTRLPAPLPFCKLAYITLALRYRFHEGRKDVLYAIQRPDKILLDYLETQTKRLEKTPVTIESEPHFYFVLDGLHATIKPKTQTSKLYLLRTYHPEKTTYSLECYPIDFRTVDHLNEHRMPRWTTETASLKTLTFLSPVRLTDTLFHLLFLRAIQHTYPATGRELPF